MPLLATAILSAPSSAYVHSRMWVTEILIRRYGSDLTQDQKDALLDVIRVRPHPGISNEIRREIVGAVERGEERPEEAGDVQMI